MQLDAVRWDPEPAEPDGEAVRRAGRRLGFRLTFSSAEAYTVLAVKATAVVLLAVTGWLQPKQRR